MNIPANIAFLEEQLARCEEAVRNSEPGTSMYEMALSGWSSIFWRLRELAVYKNIEAPESPAQTAVSLDPAQPSGTLEPGGNESVEPEAPPFDPAPEPDADLPTKQEVRTRLATLSAKYEQLNVAKIMGGMGFSRLSDIPAERYPELLRQVDEAVKELS